MVPEANVSAAEEQSGRRHTGPPNYKKHIKFRQLRPQSPCLLFWRVPDVRSPDTNAKSAVTGVVGAMIGEHTIEIRVRYHETDGQGHVHHATYLNYFELGRTELLRVAGQDYASLEKKGLRLVVSEMTCRYFRPCRFGDVLSLRTRVVRAKGARVIHQYHLSLGKVLVAEGRSTVANVDAAGRVKRLPSWLVFRERKRQ